MIARLKQENVSVSEAMSYLEDGGMGEVFGLTHIALTHGQPSVQSDTSTAMALCILAAEAIQARAIRFSGVNSYQNAPALKSSSKVDKSTP
jgi:hypothetical protein